MNAYSITDSRHLMQGLTVQCLRFRVRASESIYFDNEPGAALRGALFEALTRNFCSEAFGPEAAQPYHKATCPVCWLLGADDPQATRGENVARPYTIQPPLDRIHFASGQVMTFGVSLIGKAQDMLPYIARAVQKMGSIGVGRGRGRFKLLAIEEIHPLLDTTRQLMDGHQVKRPTLQITSGVVHDLALQLPAQAVTLDLLTPTRLTANNVLMKQITPRVFMQRLIERCQNLTEQYAEYASDTSSLAPTREDWLTSQDELLAAADRLQTGYDETSWVEAFSGSRRTGRVSPISGVMGRLRWEGNVAPLLPWLLWGSALHVGKNAVKGSGYFRLVRAL